MHAASGMHSSWIEKQNGIQVIEIHMLNFEAFNHVTMHFTNRWSAVYFGTSKNLRRISNSLQAAKSL